MVFYHAKDVSTVPRCFWSRFRSSSMSLLPTSTIKEMTKCQVGCKKFTTVSILVTKLWLFKYYFVLKSLTFLRQTTWVKLGVERAKWFNWCHRKLNPWAGYESEVERSGCLLQSGSSRTLLSSLPSQLGPPSHPCIFGFLQRSQPFFRNCQLQMTASMIIITSWSSFKTLTCLLLVANSVYSEF